MKRTFQAEETARAKSLHESVPEVIQQQHRGQQMKDRERGVEVREIMGCLVKQDLEPVVRVLAFT